MDLVSTVRLQRNDQLAGDLTFYFSCRLSAHWITSRAL
jgi:hypothetical protein